MNRSEAARGPDLELVVCTHQRAALLDRLLASVGEAPVPEGVALAVLVVANGCTDDTEAVVERHAQLLAGRGIRVRLRHEPRLGKAHALNRALGAVCGTHLVFVDDDHRLRPDFFRALVEGMRTHPGALLYCGRVLPDWTGEEPPWVRETGRWAIRPPPVPCQDWGETSRVLDGAGRLPGGGNLVVARTLAARLGPFRTDLGPRGHDLYGGEDGEWLQRALARGLGVRYLPGVVQYHYVDPQRLRLGYLVHKAYVRSRISTGLEGRGLDRVPPYQYRKILGFAVRALFTPSSARRRYYLVRLAASLGELAGMREGRRPSRSGKREGA
ncbi:MAG: glycosyltransferase [Gammaproteobacteria bacterium]|nr:MAG: glycosyltransferase [Gammaproteobacteria bacterium]